MRLVVILAAVAAAASVTSAAFDARSPLHGRLSKYEVVDVRGATATLDAASRGHGPFPERAVYTLTALGDDMRLELERNDALVPDSYREVNVDRHGRVHGDVANAEARRCHYHGRDTVSGSFAAVSLCGGGVSATVWAPDGDAVIIKPAAAHLEGGAARAKHIVYRQSDHDERRDTDWCGVSPLAHGAAAALAHSHSDAHSHGHAGGDALGSARAHIQAFGGNLTATMMLYNDRARIDQLAGATNSDALELVNIAAGYYAEAATMDGFNYSVALAVVAQINWFDEDPITATPGFGGSANINDLLTKFQSTVLPDPDLRANLSLADNSYLFSGLELGTLLSTGVVGLATVGGMCDGATSSGVVETLSTLSQAFHGVTLAHEMGHNFNMDHDVTGCTPPTGSVMANSTDPFSLPSNFSDCSRDYFNEFLAADANRACLEDALPAAVTQACGDGRVTGTEQCDCGSPNCAGIDDCCVNCMLAGGATCAGTEPCCDAATCQPVNGTVCRAAVDSDCDYPEMCDGLSGQCPTDVFAGGGVTCGEDGRSGCFAGRCQELEAACDAASGDPSAEVCDIAITDTYCQLLTCAVGSNCFTYGAPVPDGSPCAGREDASRQCLDGECVDASVLAAAAYASVGGTAPTANYTAFGTCECDTQSREFVSCGRADGSTVDADACLPYELTGECESEDEEGTCGECTSDEVDVPLAGCQDKTYVYAGAGVAAVLFLVFVFCCCCKSSKPRVQDHGSEMGRRK